MLRAAIAAVTILVAAPAIAGSSSKTFTALIAPPAGSGPQNTLTVSDATGAGLTNYPLQFGRPFLKGAIPAGECPVVTIGGVPVASQADVKDSYPDGSVKFAVMAVVIPSVAPNGSVTLGFTPGACSNTPITSAQMLDPSYNFDASLSVAGPAAVFGAPLSTTDNTLATWTPITNGGFAVTINGTAYQVSGLNFSAMTGMSGIAAIINAGLKTAGAPATLQYQVITNPGGAATVYRAVLTTTGFTGAETIAAASAPASGTDVSAMLGLAAPTMVAQGSTQAVSARTMLTAGFCKPWTSGQVAQTMACGDDSTARTYDLGFGDGYHPLRPRFYATFWPGTHQVAVRVVAENDLASEVEDVAYKASVSLGASSPATVYAADLSGTQAHNAKEHWAMSTWTQSFWLGDTPPAQVNIDNNLAYLASTRFLPNYDMAISASASGIAAEYANWTGRPHDIYDGQWDGGVWQNGMGVSGARAEIAPYPQWTVQWLYSGDWRMRQMALGMADLAGAFPAALRETVSGKRLSRDDPAGSSTGLGHTISITDRPMIISTVLDYFYTRAADGVLFVGERNVGQPWEYEGAHTPAAFYPQYLLTGDPWYLQEMYLWAGRSATFYNGASGGADGRGPGGGILGQTYREGAWTIRNRAETAFIAPDADPEQHYFRYLVNDALARYEGMFGITGTPFDGTAEKNFGISTGNYFSSNGGPLSGKQPPLGNMESAGDPNGKDGSIVADVAGGVFATADGTLTGAPIAGSFTAPWTHWYWQYAMGRLTELGFAAGPLRQLSGSWPIGLILDSGYPHLIGMYEVPVEHNATNPTPPPTLSVPPGGYFSTWPAFEGAITNAFLTGVGWPIGTGNDGSGDLDTYYASNLTDDGRPIWLMGGLAMMVDDGDPRAAAAWSWFVPNVLNAIPAADLEADPKWLVVPRTDSNVLPAMPTAVP